MCRTAAEEESEEIAPVAPPSPTWVAAAALGLSGFASLLFEIVWTRVLAMTIGPPRMRSPRRSPP